MPQPIAQPASGADHTTAHLTPASGMPWPVQSPFRMRPGLQRTEPEAHPLFWPDPLACAYRAERQRLHTLHPERLQHGSAHAETLRAIGAEWAAQTGQPPPATDPWGLALALQEDYVVLRDDTEGSSPTMRTEFLSVSFPSNWNPTEKLGLDFTAIHQPVADSALLLAGARGIVDMAFRQARMLRHVWLLTPNGDLAQHPETRRDRWEDALERADAAGGTLLDEVFFRVERQTTLPLPDLRRGVFFIRVMVCPLREALALPSQDGHSRSGELAEALASMSEAVVDYRGMAPVRARLVEELRTTAGTSSAGTGRLKR